MSDLTEVVFEGIPDRKLKDLLDSIVAMGEIESNEYGDHCEEKSLVELNMEPADVLDTRYFTNEEYGALFPKTA